MSTRTRIELGRRADLGADCANCFGLCCVALAFTKSADFPFDKPAGDPCTNLDEHDGCRIHPQLRERGFKGCTVFDCFGAGQKVSRQTFAGRSWRDDTATREAMFSTFPLVRRLHELLWYLDEAITLVERERERDLAREGEQAHAAARGRPRTAATPDPAPWLAAFEHVRRLTDGTPDELAALDVDAEYDAARPLLPGVEKVARSPQVKLMFTPYGFSQADIMRPAVSPVRSIDQPRFQIRLVSHAVIPSPLRHSPDLPHGVRERWARLTRGVALPKTWAA
ncbi:hypothetical protein [Frigoribacterium sp. PhB118]|uniref:hypothetical protein n=1 Tax=Frigoribacterium sp. PhB118 TaxID=2485175 RepID=UPI000FA484E3|nr:hypothetical protein [Frigoribacterium sp. PhB118]ROS56393.1 hypothetical protein EDF21_0032 [Frigoribacterium sp. PhB118]